MAEPMVQKQGGPVHPPVTDKGPLLAGKAMQQSTLGEQTTTTTKGCSALQVIKEDDDPSNTNDQRNAPEPTDSDRHCQVEPQSSMYPELFQQMVCTVLEAESYLFSNQELDLLTSFFMLSYPAKYLFVRLLQRKKDAWYRIDKLSAYQAEVGNLIDAKDELSRPLSEPSSECPKVEHATSQGELESQKRPKSDKENGNLALPEFQTRSTVDEATGLSMTTLLSRRSENRKEPPSSHQHATNSHTQTTPSCLDRFIFTEQDMQGRVQESLSLLSLEELKALAKKMAVTKVGTTRPQIISALVATKSQATLIGVFSSSTRHTSGPSLSPAKRNDDHGRRPRQLTLNFTPSGKKAAQTSHLRQLISEILSGGCIQIVPQVRSLVDRVALVYYRGSVLGSAALTTAILSRSRIRNYPEYRYTRSSFLFPSRDHLIAYERALEIEARMEQLLQFGKSENDHRDAVELFELVYQEWTDCVSECQAAHPDGIDRLVYHRMRFHPGWILSRIVYKGTACLARFKMYDREKQVLTDLLRQKVFRRGRRGAWYDRLALIAANYSKDAKKGKKEALEICVKGIQDPDTHLIYHDTLQRRIARLERQLRIPRSQQHDFSYSKLKTTSQVVFKGVRLDGMMMDSNNNDSQTTTATTMVDYLHHSRSSTQPSAPLTSGTSSCSSSSSLHNNHRPDSPKAGFQTRKPLYKRVKVEHVGSDDPCQQDKKSFPIDDVERDLSVDDISSASTSLLPTADDDVDPTLFMLQLTSVDLDLSPKQQQQQSSPRRDLKTTSMRSVWRGLDGQPCHVEEYCLQHYRRQGFQGYHCEGKLLTMIFVLAMWDVLFQQDIEGAFETPFQSGPLDLGSDCFSIIRAKPICQRLELIEQTGGLEIISQTDLLHRSRLTWAIGCRWDLFSRKDILQVTECLGGKAISFLCQMFCQDWQHCCSGIPDLIIWRIKDQVVKLVEVKGPGDHVSETQKVWIDILLRAGIDVQIGLVVEDKD